MNGFDSINSTSCYMEIGQDSLHALRGDAGLELSLERQADGRLTEACKERVTASLQEFLKKKFWQPRWRVFCAISARGVSLRRLTLPTANKEELDRLLLLQIESEFPLPPDQLAWGYRPLGEPKLASNGTKRTQELLVAAVKKAALEEYTKILAECGATPMFTLAALARGHLCSLSQGAAAVLHIGRQHSEYATFDNGVPSSIRVFPWGDETDTAALDPLLQALDGQGAGRKIFITGNNGAQKSLASHLAKSPGTGECEAVEIAPGRGRSAAIIGLRKAVETDITGPPLILQVMQVNGNGSTAGPRPWKWVTLAVGLALVALALPYAESLVLKPRLTKRLAAIKAERGRLSTIDHELEFLRYLKQNQPPYLDALYLISRSAPQGSRFDSISMNKRGDLSLRGSMQNSSQVSDFRSKLIDSGFFASVGVEEQTPTPDRQKVNVRMTAQWKPASERQPLSVPIVTNKTSEAHVTGGPSAGGMPPGLGGPRPEGRRVRPEVRVQKADSEAGSKEPALEIPSAPHPAPGLPSPGTPEPAAPPSKD